MMLEMRVDMGKVTRRRTGKAAKRNSATIASGIPRFTTKSVNWNILWSRSTNVRKNKDMSRYEANSPRIYRCNVFKGDPLGGGRSVLSHHTI